MRKLCLLAAFILCQQGIVFADTTLSAAQASYKRGDYLTAEKQLRVVLKGDPQNAEAHYLLGNVLVNLRINGDAKSEYESASELDPDGAAGIYSRQALLKLMGNARQAVTAGPQSSIDNAEKASMKHSVQAISHQTSESSQNNDAELKRKIQDINRTADSELVALRKEMQDRIDANGSAQTVVAPLRSGRYRSYDLYNPEAENQAVRAEYNPKLENIERDRQRKISEATQLHDQKAVALEEQAMKVEQQYVGNNQSKIKLVPNGTDRFTQTYQTDGEPSGNPVPIKAIPGKLTH